MNIDWLTVIAQIINFLILVFLLKRFLYKPILKTIADRQLKVSNKINHAEKLKQEAMHELKTYQKKNAEFFTFEQKQKKSLTDFLEAQKQQQLLEMRLEVEEKKQHLISTFKSEQTAKYHETLLNILSNTTNIIMRDLTNITLEEQCINKLLDQIKSLDANKFNKEFNIQKIEINHSFDLTELLKNKIKQELDQVLNKKIQYLFVLDRNIDWGITMTIGAYHIEWTIENHLKQLENVLMDVM